MSLQTEPAPWNTPSTLPTMPSSKLPNTNELSAEDDWTKVKDPKEKKRIQNRVAQRTYRHRMKARLGELQARLDSHEGRRPPTANGLNGTGTSHTTPPPDPHDSSVPPVMNPNTVMTNPFAAAIGANQMTGHLPKEESPSPLSAENPMSAHLPLGMAPASLYEHPVDDSDPSLFPQAAAARLLNSPPHSHTSPQPHGLLSPPGANGPPGSDHGAKVSQDFLLDCLRFQTQLVSRLNDLQPEQAFTGPYSQAGNVHAMLDQISQAEQVNTLTAFTPAHTEGMDFSFDTPQDVWKNEHFAAKVRQVPSSADSLNFSTAIPSDHGSDHLGPTMMSAASLAPPPPAPMPANASLDQRFEVIMQQAAAAGFDSFDDLVTAYYSGSFSDSSPLANEQRLSRNRRLPKVVADVSAAADSWTAWERRGFHEEVLKTAESMVMAEGANARGNITAALSPMFDAQDGINTAMSPDAMLGVKRSVQNELPNSWALAMALASDTRGSWPWDRSNTALATILLLKFSGRIPNDQLLGLLGVCLG